jgi:hypothetical protein
MGWGFQDQSPPSPSNIVNHMNVYSLRQNFVMKLKSDIDGITLVSTLEQISTYVLGINYPIIFMYILKIP